MNKGDNWPNKCIKYANNLVHADAKMAKMQKKSQSK